MAHFAKIENGIVTEVIVVHNDDAPTEQAGLAFLAESNISGTWVQTSYNGNPINGVDRGPYAGIGYAWDGTRFTAPPTPSVPEES